MARHRLHAKAPSESDPRDPAYQVLEDRWLRDEISGLEFDVRVGALMGVPADIERKARLYPEPIVITEQERQEQERRTFVPAPPSPIDVVRAPEYAEIDALEVAGSASYFAPPFFNAVASASRATISFDTAIARGLSVGQLPLVSGTIYEVEVPVQGHRDPFRLPYTIPEPEPTMTREEAMRAVLEANEYISKLKDDS